MNYIFSPKQKFAQTSVGAMAKVASIDELRFRTKYDGYVNIHPSSVVARSDKGGHRVLKFFELSQVIQNYFGLVQIILYEIKYFGHVSRCEIVFGPVQNILDLSKPIRTSPKLFGSRTWHLSY